MDRVAVQAIVAAVVFIVCAVGAVVLFKTAPDENAPYDWERQGL